MDERVEAFLADVLALEGEDANAIREGVRVALADCEQIFRAQEVNRRMKEKAAHACPGLAPTVGVGAPTLGKTILPCDGLWVVIFPFLLKVMLTPQAALL